MELYYAPQSCSLAVIILLHELQLPCVYKSVDLVKKKTHSGKHFETINPKGSVPALRLEDGKILTENLVIQQYITDKYSADRVLPSVGNQGRYFILAWCQYANTDLHKGCCAVLYNPAVALATKQTVYYPILKKKLALIEAYLQQSLYLSGDTFTLADINLFVILNWMEDLNIALKDYPNLGRYFNFLCQRKSIIEALSVERDTIL